MINSLYIKNIALIKHQEIEFFDGLNVLSGETGAGKSILINAIDIAFGAKVGKEVIKTGAEKAIIEVTIQNKKQDISKLFEEYGIDDCSEEIILSREIQGQGNLVFLRVVVSVKFPPPFFAFYYNGLFDNNWFYMFLYL